MLPRSLIGPIVLAFLALNLAGRPTPLHRLPLVSGSHVYLGLHHDAVVQGGTGDRRGPVLRVDRSMSTCGSLHDPGPAMSCGA